MTRRTFLAASGAALACLPARMHAEEGIKKPIAIGLLGASYSHAADKLKLLSASPDWSIVGAWDDSKAGRETCEKLGVKLLAQQEILANSQVVLVESDIKDHAPHAILALKAGRHVHIEKPPATTLPQMREMIDLARSRKLLLQVGYMWRHHPGFNTIIEAVRHEWLGDVFMVRGHIANNLAPARRPDWAEFHGGGMFEQGSHLVDAVVRILGRPKTVTPFTRHHGAFADTLRDNNAAIMEFDRALAVLTNSTMQTASLPARSLEIIGSNGSAILQPIEPGTLRIELNKPAGPYAAGMQTIPITYRRYEGDFAELAAAVRGEKRLSIDLETEWAVQETLLRACDMM